MDRIPILRMGRFLLVSIQVDMHDRLALTLQDDLTTRITETGARGVLIDISSLELVDSFIGRIIGTIASMAQRPRRRNRRRRGYARRWRLRWLNLACRCRCTEPRHERRTRNETTRSGNRKRHRDRFGGNRPMSVLKSSTPSDSFRCRCRSSPTDRAESGGGTEIRPGRSDEGCDRRKRTGLAIRLTTAAAGASLSKSSKTVGVRACARPSRTPGRAFATSNKRCVDGYTSGKGMGLGLGGTKRLHPRVRHSIGSRCRNKSHHYSLEMTVPFQSRDALVPFLMLPRDAFAYDSTTVHSTHDGDKS